MNVLAAREQAMNSLLQHPVLQRDIDRPVQLLGLAPGLFDPFLPELFPVRLSIVAAFGADIPNSKWLMAREMLKAAIHSGVLRPGMTVVAATSGNTGLCLAMICQALGLRFIAVVDRSVPMEKKNRIKEIGPDCSYKVAPCGESTRVHARKLEAANPHKVCCIDQYTDPCNVQGQRILAKSVLDCFRKDHLDIISVSVGSGGTAIAINEVVNQQNRCFAKVCPVLVRADAKGIPGARTATALLCDGGGFDFSTHFDFPRYTPALGTEIAHEFARFCSSKLWNISGIPVYLGPSAGLALANALMTVRWIASNGQDELCKPSGDPMHVVIFAADGAEVYAPEFKRVLGNSGQRPSVAQMLKHLDQAQADNDQGLTRSFSIVPSLL